jgi:hypothetical protein
MLNYFDYYVLDHLRPFDCCFESRTELSRTELADVMDAKLNELLWVPFYGWPVDFFREGACFSCHASS